jgi:hypothetical protein
MLFTVFLPKQFERQIPMLFQLPADVVEVRLCSLWSPWRCLVRWKQGVLKPLFIPVCAERPLEGGGFGARQIIVHRALADVYAAGDLPLPEFLLEVEPQNLSDLSHGLSLSGQLRQALLWADLWSPVVSSPAPPFSSFSFHSDHRSLIPITSGRKSAKVIGISGEY